MNATIVEYIGGIEVIKAFNQGKNSYAKFAQRVRANAAYFYNWMKSCQLPISFSKAISPTTLITILPVGWLLYQSGSLSVETFITVIILSLGIAGPLLAGNGLRGQPRQGGHHRGRGRRHPERRGTNPRHPAGFAAQPGHRCRARFLRLSRGRGGPPRRQPQHPLGQHGRLRRAQRRRKIDHRKTHRRLLGCKEGAHHPRRRDLRDIPLAQLYDKVAFVSQDNYLFDDTVRENIRMGRLDASDAEVEAVARAAGCDAFIRALENGYDTKVGGGGAHLSGGERQRIAIARAC